MKRETGDASRLLREREKELDALYRLAALFTRSEQDIGRVLSQTADILRKSMQFPARAVVSIESDGHYTIGKGKGKRGDSYRAERSFGLDRSLCLSVAYYGAPARTSAASIEEREKRLIDATASLLTEVIQRSDMERTLRESTKTLQLQADDLERKNIAMREMLYQIDSEKRSIRRDARKTVDTLILPFIHRLKGSPALTGSDALCVTQIEQALERFVNDQTDTVLRLTDILTRREVEICGLIRNGLTSKEMAGFLHISEMTVERHRNTIRRKLGLTNKKTNLNAYLHGLP